MIQALLAEAPSFSFFQAVRLLQALHPDSARVGYQGPPHKECLRFTSTLSLGFPASDMSAVELEETSERQLAPLGLLGEEDERLEPIAVDEDAKLPEHRFRVAATFLGLYGPDSPLPTSYTEELINRDDMTLVREFYDLFQHRFHSLFYRVWERYRYAIRFQPDGDDYYSLRLAQLLHLSPKLQPRGAFLPTTRLLTFAGSLGAQPRSARGLQGALRTLFPEVHVLVEEFVERWLEIPTDQQCHLATLNTVLGVDAHLGTEIRDRNCTFRVSVEPRDLDEFLRFLPGSDKVSQLRELVDLYVTDFLDYEVEVRLHESAVPELRLSAPSALLGWSTWLGAPPPEERRIRILFQGALHG